MAPMPLATGARALPTELTAPVAHDCYFEIYGNYFQTTGSGATWAAEPR
jgi:hypothetical protein